MEKDKKSKKEPKTPKKETEKSNRKESKEKNRSRSRSRSNNKNKDDPKSTSNKVSTPLDPNKVYKIIHWNIAGLKQLLNKKELDELIKNEKPDFVCFNETKIDNEFIKSMKLNDTFRDKYKFNSYWNCSVEKKGYSGTGILTSLEPISVSYGINVNKHDKEGRVLTLEFDKFYLISCYTPNAGEGLKRVDYRVKEWDKDFFEYINSLKSKKDIILCGDLNVAREDIDIFDPKGKEKLAGFSKQEKESFNKFLEMGYVDTFRELHKDDKKYSFFSRRTKGKESNKGWRLDYFVINKDPKNIVVKDSDMIDKDKYNASDHIPLVFTFNCKN